MTKPNETWDYYSSRINQRKEIDEIEKQELLRNWGYLRDVFGDDWFKKEESHPLRWYLINQAPWCLRWVGELGFGIKCLNEKENFEDILNKLRLNTIDFEETYSEFRVGYSLFKLGISFEFLKPHKKQKTPDMVMNVDNRKIFIEITTKRTPEAFLNSWWNFSKINDYFFMSKIIASSTDLEYYFDILTSLYPATVESIIELCDDLFEDVKKSGFEEFHIPGIIDIYILKKDNIERVPKEKRVIQSVTKEPDELYRIKDTISTKEVQLRAKNPNILIIFDRVLQPYKSKEFFDLENVKIIEKHINGFPNLGAVIIYVETYYSPDVESSVKEKENFIAVSEYDEKLLILKNKVIILNKSAEYPLSPHEIEILKSI